MSAVLPPPLRFGGLCYHQVSACKPYVSPLVRSLNGTPPTKPRNPFDQLAYVRNARSTGRLKNWRPAPICGAIVNLRSQPSNWRLPVCVLTKPSVWSNPPSNASEIYFVKKISGRTPNEAQSLKPCP